MSMRKLLLFLIFLVPLAVVAQTGKITGTVSDAETGEPLVGANVTLENTSLGAMTDVDGYFIVLNVPAGTYSVRANYVGYTDIVTTGIRVTSGVTANQNFALKASVEELDAVIVEAERPLVEKNQTQSYSLVTSEEIENVPVRGLTNLLALQASVVVQDGAVHIRGGRSEEIGYYVDGASTSSITSNANNIYMIQDALEEVQVLAGGYSAEFGGANSGIVRTQIKSGTPEYHATLGFQTDKFADEGEKFLGTYSYRHHILNASVGGPITKNIRFFVAAENRFLGDTQQRFSKGFEFRGLVDTDPTAIANHTQDTVDLIYPSGFTPRNEEDRYALNGSLVFDYNPFKVRLSGTFSTREAKFDNAPMLNILDKRQRSTHSSTFLLTAKGTYIVSPTSYVEAILGAYNVDSENEDSELGNDWAKWHDSAAVNIPGAYKSSHRRANRYLLHGITFARNGRGAANYFKSHQSYLSAAVKFTNQINKNHEIKVGADARFYTVRSFGISATGVGNLWDANTDSTITNIKQFSPNVWSQNTGVETYGYDLYGNETTSEKDYKNGVYTLAPKQPVIGSMFIQDKMEFDDLIVNAGLRLDYFDSDDKYFEDPSDIKFDKNSGLAVRDQYKDKEAEVLISPRLGFSFPVSEKAVFYFQYGKYAQLPALNQVYSGVNSLSADIRGGYANTSVGFGLDPIKTTNYEIGLRRQISDYAAFDVTGFYRNIKGQIQVIRQTSADGAEHPKYNRLANGDYATTKGLEVKLTLRRVNRLQASANYTLTDAQGTGSGSTSHIAALERGTNKPTVVNPLNYSQKHRGSINLDYRFGANDGGPVFENFGANVVFNFNSGHPYTLVKDVGGQSSAYTRGTNYMSDTRSRQALEPVNSSSTPWFYNLDLRLDKSFDITDKLGATVFVRVTNLFNTKNVINVFESTGKATDDGFLSNPDNLEAALEDPKLGQNYVDLYRALNLENGSAYLSQLGRELFGTPRQIMIGVKLAY